MEFGWLAALLLGIVEGLTEFLPVSSTGHLILASALLGLHGPKIIAFEIVIQGAAILAVCWEYRRLLIGTATSLTHDPNSRRFALNVVLGFLPLAVLGLLFKDVIEARLFHPVPVAIALVLGGIAILWVDGRKHSESMREMADVTPAAALKLGFWQSLALVPGTSRSAATIIGGTFMGMSRRLATEYSFFLAIPTLLGATLYKFVEARQLFSQADLVPLAIGSVVAFVTALIAVRGFLRFVSTHTFAVFAWYRIAFGALVLLTYALGFSAW